MTRRVARAALAYAAVGARARVCEVTIQVDGAGVGLAFADDVELDAAVRGFVARFALPLDQMGCADDASRTTLRLWTTKTPRGQPGASLLDDDDAARYEPDADAPGGQRAGAPAGSALLPSTLEDYVTLWMVAWSACFAVAAVVAALDRSTSASGRCQRFRRAFAARRGAGSSRRAVSRRCWTRANLLPNLHDAPRPRGLCSVGAVGRASLHDVKVGASYALYALEAALGAAQLAASRMRRRARCGDPALGVAAFVGACSSRRGLGKQWAYAALVQLWVALTPDDPGPSAGAVGVLFQIWATHAFAGAEKSGLGREWVTGGARAARRCPSTRRRSAPAPRARFPRGLGGF
ncbi:hypothetical protein JL721_12060 [Aureococcus anophagefferens]|nr:hypothetical protein JL721_12060 [Aureococcus anophagefferens]